MNWIYFFCVSIVLHSCVKIPQQIGTYHAFEKIKVAPGPEDIQLYFDTHSFQYKLLVSCDDRRSKNSNGSIWYIELQTHQSYPFTIIFNQKDAVFHPHGIHVHDEFLFVIDHDNIYKKSRIFRFKICGDTLIEDALFEKGLIGYPNDLVATNKDVFLYSDYSLKGSVVRYENGKYTKLITQLHKPNGIDSISIDGYPFGLVSCTYGKKVYRFDTQTGEKMKIATIKGGDNFTYNEEKVLLAGHLRFYKFTQHYKKHKASPSVVYELDVMNRAKKAVFVDDGTKISAVSTALYFNNRIYLGQIFDDFVLVGFVSR